MLDIIIRNATIIDGTGEPAYRGEIGILNGKIHKLAPNIDESASTIIQADGLYASPGFIDIHSHDDIVFDKDPFNLPKLMQGVTTVVVGNCGFGAVPSTNENRRLMQDYNMPILGQHISGFAFESFSAYAAHMRDIPKAQNVAMLLPHGAVYIAVNGFSGHAMSSRQLQEAEDYVREAMEAGAIGMSLGLMYAPGCYSVKEELHRLGKVVSEYGGIICVHMKSESGCFEKSIEDAAELSIHCQVPVEISHFKHVGKQYWGRISDAFELVQRKNSNGAKLSFDMYPYTMGSTTMSILFPTNYLLDGVGKLVENLKNKSIREEIKKALRTEDWGDEDNLSMLCGWENVIVSSAKTTQNQMHIGKSILEIANERDVSGEDAMMDLYLDEQGEVSVLLNHIKEQDMIDTLLYPDSIPATDGIPGAKTPHPRLYGSFPKFLKEFVRERELLSWETAIRKITSMPARRFGLGDRGILRESYDADIVLFNPLTIADTATYSNPRSYPAGIEYVIVGGSVAMEKGAHGNTCTGKLLLNAHLNK